MTDNRTQLQEIEAILEEYKEKQEQMTQEKSQEIVEKMLPVRFIVPVTFANDETLAAMQAELERTGKPVKLPKDAKPIPVLIQNPNKEHFLAVYTSLSQFPKDHRSNGVIEMTFESCMSYVRNAKNPVSGVVVNPFTSNFIVRPRREQRVTPAQFHLLARKNVEYVLLPHSIYTKDKAYFDSISAELLFSLFKDQYMEKLPIPYEEDDFEVMQLGIDPKLDMIHISMPAKKLVPGACVRIYATWHTEAACPGYYMIVRGEKKDAYRLIYIHSNGRNEDLGEAPVESMEMQQVLKLELERYMTAEAEAADAIE